MGAEVVLELQLIAWSVIIESELGLLFHNHLNIVPPCLLNNTDRQHTLVFKDEVGCEEKEEKSA